MNTMNTTIRMRDAESNAIALLAIITGPLARAAMNHRKPRQAKTSKMLLPKMFAIAMLPNPVMIEKEETKKREGRDYYLFYYYY